MGQKPAGRWRILVLKIPRLFWHRFATTKVWIWIGESRLFFGHIPGFTSVLHLHFSRQNMAAAVGFKWSPRKFGYVCMCMYTIHTYIYIIYAVDGIQQWWSYIDAISSNGDLKYSVGDLTVYMSDNSIHMQKYPISMCVISIDYPTNLLGMNLIHVYTMWMHTYM